MWWHRWASLLRSGYAIFVQEKLRFVVLRDHFVDFLFLPRHWGLGSITVLQGAGEPTVAQKDIPPFDGVLSY